MSRLYSTALIALLAVACTNDSTVVSPERQASAVGETVTIVRGDNQTGASNAQLASGLRFIVRNAGGTPVADARGTILVSSGGGSVSRATFRTGLSGEIAFNWTLGPADIQIVTAALNADPMSPAFGRSVTFHASAFPVGTRLVATVGDNQIGSPGDSLVGDVRVRLVNGDGDSISGAAGLPIEWRTTGGGKVRTVSGKLNSTGRASNRWLLGWDALEQTLVGKVAGIDSIVFHATASGAGITLEIQNGNDQIGNAGGVLEKPLAVIVKKNGVPVVGARGMFTVASGGGGLSRTSFLTNSFGRATALWTLGALSPDQHVHVSIGPFGSVMFNATATAP